MNRSTLALVLATLFAIGCGSSSSDSGSIASNADSGTPPAADSGAPATNDSGPTTTPADAGGGPIASDAGPACTTKTYASFGQAFFASKCNGCHSATRPVLTTQAAIKTNLSRVKAEIQSGAMPQGSRLSAQEKADVLEWLNCGAL